MKKIFFIIILFFININFSIALGNNKECNNIKNTIYKEYCNNVFDYCRKEAFYKSNKKFVYSHKKNTPNFEKLYPSVEELKKDSTIKYLLNWNKTFFPIEAIKTKYRYIQNEIYKCGLIAAQYNSINIIIENAKLDKTWQLKTIVEKKFKPIQKRLKNNFKSCNLKTKDVKITKKRILDQSTFELCKYSYYLDYLYKYYNNIENILWVDKEGSLWSKESLKSWTGQNNKNKNFNKLEYNSELISSLQKTAQTEIKKEKEHSYEVFKIAFTAYSEYQSYYPIHLSLELLKDNLILYREKLYKVLNPINQVVYKIINAMSK